MGTHASCEHSNRRQLSSNHRHSQDPAVTYISSHTVTMVLAVDLLNPAPQAEAKKHKLKTLVPAHRWQGPSHRGLLFPQEVNSSPARPVFFFGYSRLLRFNLSVDIFDLQRTNIINIMNVGA